MKILLIPEVSLTGGTGTFLKQLIEINSSLGVKTHVLIPRSLAGSILVDYFTINSVEYTEIPDRRGFEWNIYFSFLYELRHYTLWIVRLKPDILMCSNGTVGLNFSLFLFKLPLIFVMHSYPRVISWWAKPFFLLPRILSKPSKVFYTVSNFSKQKIVDIMRVRGDLVNVIYNSSKKRGLKKKTDSRRLILTVGHVVYYKNPFLWIDVARKVIDLFPDVDFAWLGEGDLFERCRSLTKDDNHIDFLGFVSNPNSFYADAFIYLHPSDIESLGYSVIEAMSFGVPCVVSDAGGLPETVEHGVSGFVCPTNSVDSYVSSIVRLLCDDELFSQFSINSRRLFEAKFDELVQKERVAALYAGVLGRSN